MTSVVDGCLWKCILFEMNIIKPKESQDDGAKVEHRNPFQFMRMEDNTFLDDIDGRSACSKCSKSRKFFCYTCYEPVGELRGKLPAIRLPVKIDIIKHQKENDGKSTAIHAALLAAGDVKIYTYPDIPDYSEADDRTVSSKTKPKTQQ